MSRGFRRGDPARKCERVDGELRNWLIGRRVQLESRMWTAPLRTCRKSMCPVTTRGALPADRPSAIPCWCSSAAMACSAGQIGISIATVTLSLASMNFCKVSWRSLLFPTAGMMRAAASVAAFCLRFTMMRETSANSGCAWDAGAFGSSSRRNRSCCLLAALSSLGSSALAVLLLGQAFLWRRWRRRRRQGSLRSRRG